MPTSTRPNSRLSVPPVLHGLLAGMMAGAGLPGGQLSCFPWVIVAPLLYGPLFVWPFETRCGGWQVAGMIAAFWWGWTAVGYRWLLAVDLDSALQLPFWLAMAGKTGAWVFNASYWALLWSVPFWAGLLVVKGLGRLNHSDGKTRWPGLIGQLASYLLVVLASVALWWPILNDRTINLCWLTPGLATAQISALQNLVSPHDSLWVTMFTWLVASLVGGLWVDQRWLKQTPWWSPVVLSFLSWFLFLVCCDGVNGSFPAVDLPVVALQGNSPLKTIRYGTTRQQQALEAHYLALARQATQDPKVRFILLPEEGALAQALLVKNGTLTGLAPWQDLANQTHRSLLLGATVVEGSRQTNELIVLNDDRPPQRQAKGWLVPFGERYPGLSLWQSWFARVFPAEALLEFEPGPARPQVLVAGTLPIGALNCVEVADEAMARHFRQRGVHLLTVSANLGWFAPGSGLSDQFLAHGRWRARQTGLFVLIAANSGPSALIAPNGEVLKTLPSDTSGILQIKNRR